MPGGTVCYLLLICYPRPHRLPPSSVHLIVPSLMTDLIVDAIVIAIVSYVINISQASLFAKKSGYKINSNQVWVVIWILVCRILFQFSVIYVMYWSWFWIMYMNILTSWTCAMMYSSIAYCFLRTLHSSFNNTCLHYKRCMSMFSLAEQRCCWAVK